MEIEIFEIIMSLVKFIWLIEGAFICFAVFLTVTIVEIRYNCADMNSGVCSMFSLAIGACLAIAAHAYYCNHFALGV